MEGGNDIGFSIDWGKSDRYRKVVSLTLKVEVRNDLVDNGLEEALNFIKTASDSLKYQVEKSGYFKIPDYVSPLEKVKSRQLSEEG